MSNPWSIQIMAVGISVLVLLYPSFLIYDQMTYVPSEKNVFIEAIRYEFSPSLIRANLGDTITFVIKSNDSRHGFYIDEFGINEEINVQAQIEIILQVDRSGTFIFQCNIPCGNFHPYMNGKLVVKPNALLIFSVIVVTGILLYLIWKSVNRFESRNQVSELVIIGDDV